MVHEAIAQRIYELYPVIGVARPPDGGTIYSTNSVVGFNPWELSESQVYKGGSKLFVTGKKPNTTSLRIKVIEGVKRQVADTILVKERYNPVAFVDESWEGIFDNDPVSMRVLMEENIAVYLPDDFQGRLNPSFRWTKIGGRTKLWDISGVSAAGGIASVRLRKETTGEINREGFNKRVEFASRFIRNAGGAADVEIDDPNRSAVGAKTTLNTLRAELNDIVLNAQTTVTVEGADAEFAPTEKKKDTAFAQQVEQLETLDKAVEKAQTLFLSPDPAQRESAADQVVNAKRNREAFYDRLRKDVLRDVAKIRDSSEVEGHLKKYQSLALQLAAVTERAKNLQPNFNAKVAEINETTTDKTEQEALIEKELSVYKSENAAIKKETNSVTLKRDAAFDALKKIALHREGTRKGAATRVTQDPETALRKLRRFLRVKKGQMALTEANFNEAAVQLQAEFSNEALFFQLRLSLQGYFDDNGLIKEGQIGSAIDAFLRSVDPVAGIDPQKKAGERYKGLKYTPTTGRVTRESKQAFAYFILNDQIENPVKRADKGDNYQTVFQSYLEESIIKRDGIHARNRMPTYDEVGKRVAERLNKQQGRRKGVEVEEGTGMGAGRVPATTGQEISELGLESTMQFFVEMNLDRGDIDDVIRILQEDVIDILGRRPDLEAQLDGLLEQGPFNISQTDVYKTFSVEEKWNELVAYSKLGSQENNPAPIAFVQSLRKAGTVEAEILQRALRLFEMGGIEFGKRDPFAQVRTYWKGNEIDTEEFLVKEMGTVTSEGETITQENIPAILKDVVAAEKYTRWLTDEIRSIANQKGETVSDVRLRMRAANVHSTISKHSGSKSYFSRSDFQNALDRAVAIDRNNHVAGWRGLKTGNNDPDTIIAALQKISGTPALSENVKNAARVLLFKPEVIHKVKFTMLEGSGVNAGRTRISDTKEIHVLLDLNGYNGRGLIDVLLHECFHASLLDSLEVDFNSVTPKQKNARSRLRKVREAVRDKVGRNAPTDLTDGLENLQEFVAHMMTNTKFQEYFRGQLDGLGLREKPFKKVIDDMMMVIDPNLAQQGKKYRDAFYDVVDLQGYAESKPLSSVGQRQEAVNAAAYEWAQHDILYARFKSVTGVDVETIEGTEGLTQEEIDQLNARARDLAAFVKMKVPPEIDVVIGPLPEGKVIAFIRATNTLMFDPKNAALGMRDAGMSPLQAKELISKLIRHEFAHKAAQAALTPEMVQNVIDKSGIGDFKRDINDYYGEDTPEARAALARLTGPDAAKSRKEKERLVQERLAAYVENAIDGLSSAKAAAFFTSNPSLLETIAFYFKAFINKFIRAFNDGTAQLNAEERIAVNRMLVETRAIEMGYRLPKMDPTASPQETVRRFLITTTGVDPMVEPTEPTDEGRRLEVSPLARAGTVVPNTIPVDLGKTDQAYVDKATGRVTTVRSAEGFTVPVVTGEAAPITERELGTNVLGEQTLADVKPIQEEETVTATGRHQLDGAALLEAQQEAEALFEEHAARITVESFRQLALTVFLQRMGKGSLSKNFREYQNRKDKLAKLAFQTEAEAEEEVTELKKFFAGERELAHQLFDMWKDHAKVGPTNAEAVVRDEQDNVIPLSERFKFDINVPIGTAPTPDNEALLRVFAPALGLKTDANLDDGGILYSGFRAKGQGESETPTWKIEALKQARRRPHFESFDLHGDQARAGFWTAALVRSGLIENVGQYPSRATKYTITTKGLDALRAIEAAETRREEEVDDGGILYARFGARHRAGDSEFDAFDFNYNDFFEQFDMPVLEVGDLEIEKGVKGFIKKHLVGLLQPEIHHWMKHRQALKKGLGQELEIIHGKLKRLVATVYPDGVPIDGDEISLIQRASGSTEGAILNDVTQDRLDTDYADAKIDAWQTANDAHDAGVKSADEIERDFDAALLLAKAQYDVAEQTALDNRRNEIIAERNAALQEIANDSTELFTVLKALRRLADNFTKKLQQVHGESDTNYKVNLDSNLGIYLTRSYKIFMDIGYADAVRNDPKYQANRDAAIAFFRKQHMDIEKDSLRREHPDKTDAEIEQMAVDDMNRRRIGERALEAYISAYEAKGGENYFSAEESIKSMIDNLKAKNNIPKVLRDILGEQKDTNTPDNMLRTIMTIGSMAANQAFLNQVAKAGLDNGWLVRQDRAETEDAYEGWKPIVNTKSDRGFNPLSGLYAKPDLAKAFAETFKKSGTVHANESEGLMARFLKFFQIMTGLSMATKTLGSVGFYIRNGLSNILFFGPMQLSVVTSLKMSKNYGVRFGSEMKRAWKGDKAKLDNYIAELRALRLVGDESRTNTMRQLMLGEQSLEDVTGELDSLIEGTRGKVRTAAGKIGLGKLPRMAASMDSFFKIAYFENELQVLQEAAAADPMGKYGTMSSSQLKREAAGKVLRTTQAYSEAPPIVKAFQRSPFGSLIAPFVRFKADVIRVLVNTWKVAREEQTSGNAVLVKRGNQRMRGAAFTIGFMSFGINALLKMFLGISDDEDEAIKAAGPEWAKYHNPLYIRWRGELRAINMTYTNPFSVVTDSVQATIGEIINPDGNPDSAIEALFKSFIVDQYLSEQILVGAMAEAWSGEDKATGKRVFIKGVDTGVEKATKQWTHLFKKGFEPRTLEKARSAWMTSDGDYTEWDYSPAGIILNEFAPMRSRVVNPEQLFKQYIYKSELARKQIREKFRPIYHTNASVSEGEIHDIYDAVYKDLMHLNRDMIQKMKAFEGLGLSKGEVYGISRGSGGGPKIGKRRTELLLQGYMEKPVLSANKVALMMEEAKTDPKMAERLKIFADAVQRYDRFSQIDD